MGERPLVRDVLPGLAAELERSLRELGRPELARQVRSLRLWAVCPCEVEGCGSFFTALPMKRWFRRGKEVSAGDPFRSCIPATLLQTKLERVPTTQSSAFLTRS